MNKLLLIIFLMSSCLGLNAQTNRALIVAIDKYPDGSGWNDIHGTNDAEIVLKMLRANNFHKSNIHYLQNQRATKLAVVEQLKVLASTSRKGDYIYIHFSCHGQLMLDDNGDEPSGLDQAMIPYDAKRRLVTGVYEGQNHLRDDELGVLFDNIRGKIGPLGNLVVVLDACHSGTANRDGDDENYVRGTAYVFAPEGYSLPAIDPTKMVLSPSSASNLATITVFSACEPEQINYEYRDSSGEYYGALSYAVIAIMRDDNAMATNKDMFLAISKKINTMFAGKKWRQTPYFESTDESKAFKIGK